MNFFKRLLFTAAAVAFIFTQATAQTAPKGHLLIIGGGTRTTEVMQRFVELGGGTSAKFLIISTAGLSEERGEGAVKELNGLGVKKVQWIAPMEKELCNDPKYVDKMMKGVTGVFFTGGQQRTILKVFGGTLFHERLMQMYEEGGIIGGTSAGAAMMTDPMTAGGPKHKNKDDKDGFTSIEKDNVYFYKGMGFLKGAVVDQHFFKRSRENRLFSAALDRPEYVHIGIDEATGLLVSNGRDIEIVGESNVMIVEPVPGTIKVDKNGHYGTTEMTVRLLVAGDTYTIPER